ncbi:efflux transporter outer membrane subunit [Fodinibius salsisoli]|uniref:Efflux transporter outer membrane subunit n=1 Tax=Fodinibius salsisoli TaxID=2820877 RepID=A0ABT3PKC5_9BACT|nr:efflux transporter outer membrane subunit [Fodinibius salsisoli]MCW9706399.1 efflux transporter outer membrane subunit [Fodinibius salsisoli]
MALNWKDLFKLFLIGPMVIGLFGCVSQTKTVSNPVASPPDFSAAGTQEVPERWWTVFDNQQLNQTVEKALSSNFNLKSAWQRLKASQAIADRQSAALLPSLEASARGETTESQSNVEDDESFELGLTAVYELDLWGSIRSSAEAEEYRARASLADYQTAGLSLSAEIVRTWYQIAAAKNQRSLVESQVKTNRQVLGLLKNRLGIGQVQGVDILRQERLLESTLQQKSIVESRIQVLEHQLAVLLGESPQKDLSTSAEHLPDLPPLPETGLSTELVRRRPDVRSAFNLLQAADRDLASAISNQYPRLTLTASASSAAENANNLFEDWALSFAGNLLAPIFYGGELSAEVDRTEAIKRQRLYEYGQAILTAFQEVEDALIREEKQKESIESLQEQVSLSVQAYERLQNQYFNGTSNYLDVLTALDEVQQLRRDLLTAQLTLIEYRVALYRALAGSFKIEQESRE